MFGRAQRYVSVSRTARADRPVVERISFWLMILILGAVLAHGYNMTQIDKDSDLGIKSHFFLLILIIGVVARGVMAAVFNYKIELDVKMDVKRLALYMVFAGMLIVGSGWVWSMTASESPEFLVGATVMQVRLFYTFGAVAEELFWIWAMFLPLSVVFGVLTVNLMGRGLPVPPWFFALITCSVLFAFFHRAVYETAPQLWLMFIYRAVFTMSYVLSAWWGGTRDITVAVLAHVTVNYLASG